MTCGRRSNYVPSYSRSGLDYTHETASTIMNVLQRAQMCVCACAGVQRGSWHLVDECGEGTQHTHQNAFDRWTLGYGSVVSTRWLGQADWYCVSLHAILDEN